MGKLCYNTAIKNLPDSLVINCRFSEKIVFFYRNIVLYRKNKNAKNTIYCAANASAQLYGVVQYSRFSFIYGTLALLKQRFLQVLSPLQKFHLPDILQKADFRTPG